MEIKTNQKMLLDVIMNIAVVIYSWHLSCWSCSGLLLFFKRIIYLNPSMFMRIICGPASPTEDVSIWFFYEYLQIAFPNNVLFASSYGNSNGWRVGRTLGWALHISKSKISGKITAGSLYHCISEGNRLSSENFVCHFHFILHVMSEAPFTLVRFHFKMAF